MEIVGIDFCWKTKIDTLKLLLLLLLLLLVQTETIMSCQNASILGIYANANNFDLIDNNN